MTWFLVGVADCGRVWTFPDRTQHAEPVDDDMMAAYDIDGGMTLVPPVEASESDRPTPQE